MTFARSFAPSLVLAAAVAAGVGAVSPMRAADVDQLQKDFQSPPDDARIMVRWWWFGPAVTKEGITRELTAMKTGGIGGVEVQCTYPLAVDGGTGATAVKNLQFLSPEHLEMLAFCAAKCKELGLRMDLTLGSGWPYGGPMFSASEGAGKLETAVVQVRAGQATVPVPAQRAGRTVFAAFAGPAVAVGGGRGGGGGGDMSGMKEITITNGVAALPAGFAGGEVIFFVSGRTGMQVKRPADGAEGNVIDHLSAAVVDKFIKDVAEPEINACGPNPPHAIFCDSLEVQGENWTDDMLAEFQKRRGYDLKPYLPALLGNFGDKTDAIRHDWAQTVTDVFNDNFNGKLQNLAKKHGSLYRVQGYGSPPAGLYSYASSDLPEGEGGGNGLWRTFRATRYASSASHLIGQKITSSETFTWLHQAPFRATPVDMKGEADTHFLDGINQFVCHGWPYTPNSVVYPGASFYAAAVFDDKNPWYVAMPEISGYMQRVSAILREGIPANDVALYLADSDVWAAAGTGYSSMNAAYTQNSGLLGTLVDAGYDLDAWDDGMFALKGKVDGGALAFGDVKYKVVMLPNVRHLPIETARALKQMAEAGGTVIAIGQVPSRVPGVKATAEQQTELQSIMTELFSGAAPKGMLVANTQSVLTALGKKLAPDVALDKTGTLIGEVHRHTAGGEVYFLANTSNQKQSVNATFRVEGLNPELWNPLTGKVKPIAGAMKVPGGTKLALEFEPLASTIVVFTSRQPTAVEVAGTPGALDMSTGWTVTFGATGKAMPMNALASWLDVAGERNFSGVAAYEKKITATAAMAAEKSGAVIHFGDATPMAGGRGGNGYVAEVTSPVRDAAVVFVNGKRAGAAWCPPFDVDISGLLKEGENTVRVEVGNTAVNELAAAGFPNYNLAAIRQQFGNRFDPQGNQLLAQPLPSGLSGPIKLEWTAR